MTHFEFFLRKTMLERDIPRWGDLCRETGMEPRLLLDRRTHPENLRLYEVRMLADALGVPAIDLVASTMGRD